LPRSSKYFRRRHAAPTSDRAPATTASAVIGELHDPKLPVCLLATAASRTPFATRPSYGVTAVLGKATERPLWVISEHLLRACLAHCRDQLSGFASACVVILAPLQVGRPWPFCFFTGRSPWRRHCPRGDSSDIRRCPFREFFRCTFCGAQVTGQLNLNTAIRVILTVPQPNLSMTDAKVCMVPPGQECRDNRQHNRSGSDVAANSRTARRQRPSRVASVRQDPNWPFPMRTSGN
jgi:hypothetical protein